jgi:uncharacterized protein (DUF433 family)
MDSWTVADMHKLAHAIIAAGDTFYVRRVLQREEIGLRQAWLRLTGRILPAGQDGVAQMSARQTTAQYGDFSPNDFPMYGIRDAARYLKIPSATLRAWFAGTNRGAFRPVLGPAAFPPLKLSFNNLAEAYVLHNLRTEHDVKLSNVRQAIAEAERRLGIDRLLLRKDLKAHAGEILIETFDQYLTLGASGQYAIKVMLDAVLERFIWEDPNFPSMLFPFLPGAIPSDKVVAINPKKSFGAPYLASRGITTAVIASRFDAGESIPFLAKDYTVDEKEISAAIVYEKAA